ncbi:hypothetical protein [Amnibacterium endophyticum]|uniref:DUF4129 domain-containing protein n=1 Tax=Amnibacterium endophyticum TaxID=2109337 RepID=A0ABW4LIL6_9MICO
MPYEPIIPEGGHLGTSHGPDGGLVGLIFDDVTGKLIGQASWHDTGESAPELSDWNRQTVGEQPRPLTSEEQAALAALAALIVLAAIAAAPAAKRWWGRAVVPAFRAAWRRMVPEIRRLRNSRGEDADATRAEVIESGSDAKVVLADSKITMSSAEWASRHQVMLAASTFSEEQRQLLSLARVLDGGPAGQQLTAQQFADRVQLKLQANPAVLEEPNSAAVLSAATASPGRAKGILQLEQ